MRKDNRPAEELRAVTILPHFTKMAAGSVLMECGDTRVICTASVSDGVPPFLRGKGKGWVTAEYAMLPGATPQRKARDGVKKDGRSVEIQRLIGRALRSVCDLHALGERTVYLDCDVIQADGGTRTASITGAYVALCLAVEKLIAQKVLYDTPIRAQIAAVSVGVVKDRVMADLCYEEDSSAQVDMNIVMVREGDEMRFAEVQGTGEERTFSRDELLHMMEVGERGIRALMQKQLEVLANPEALIQPKPLLVVATANPNKVREFSDMLGGEFRAVSMKELGIDTDIEETGQTFEENAMIKAKALHEMTGCMALADDSGIEVDALSGKPGIYSARYAGEHGNDGANNQKLIAELSGHPHPHTGRYVCALALVRSGKPPIVVRGECEGQVIDEYRGNGGFGYDPIFYLPEHDMTYAQLPNSLRYQISHRSAALGKLRKALCEAP